MSDADVNAVIARAARDSYGRLVAILAARSGDVAAAEDALSEAILSALRQWPRDGERMLQDGPFADTKEQLGGYFVVDVDDLDAALEWAARCPSATYGSVEVRPLMPSSPAM